VSEPVPNLPLLRKVLAQIDAEPWTWEQRTWAVLWRTPAGANLRQARADQNQIPETCGTAFCIAGHTALMEGWSPIWCGVNEDFDFMPGRARTNWVKYDGDGREVDRRYIASIAGEALGLTEGERIALFDEFNSRSRIQQIAEAIATRAGEEL
jgi:hypothetical protein